MTQSSDFSLNRRSLLKGGLVLGAASMLGGTLLGCAGRTSKAPIAPRTVGAYPFTVGDIQGFVLSDGTVRLEPATPTIVTNAPDKEVKTLLEQSFLPTDYVDAPINTVLFRVGKRNVLIDVGYGPGGSPKGGLQTEALASLGLEPKDIDTIFITHAHPDHLHGFSDANGLPRFPKAELVISETEYNFWSNPDNDIAKVQGLFDAARKNFAAAGDRLRTVKGGGEIVPGLVAEAAHGHTPGHSAVRVTSGTDDLLVTADTANHPILFLRHPEWVFGYDFNPTQAVETRKKRLDQLATDKTRILAYHFPFPGIGRIKPLWSGAYEFLSEPWSPV
ncbi:MBL fold metallo-hydrolase [bacterium]|nr:MBL fold metallo-hydrolase [bacterium]